MSFYFGPRNNALRRVQFAAAASFFDQLLPRDAAQSEGQNFFDQRVDLTRTPPRNLAEQFLEEFSLVLKVEVEGASCDASAGDDISDIGPMVAFAREYPLGMTQHLGAPGLSFHYANPQEN